MCARHIKNDKPVKRFPERSRRMGPGSVARASRADAGRAVRCRRDRSSVVYSGSSVVMCTDSHSNRLLKKKRVVKEITKVHKFTRNRHRIVFRCFFRCFCSGRIKREKRKRKREKKRCKQKRCCFLTIDKKVTLETLPFKKRHRAMCKKKKCRVENEKRKKFPPLLKLTSCWQQRQQCPGTSWRAPTPSAWRPPG